MTARQKITIEDILKSETSLGDLYYTWQLLVQEIPAFSPTLTLLGFLALAEVILQVSVAVISRFVLDGAITDRPQVDSQLIVLALILSLITFFVLRQRQIKQEQLALQCRQQAVRRLAQNIVTAEYEDLTAVPMAALREILMTDVSFSYRFFIEVLSQGVIICFWLIASVLVTLWFSPALLSLMLILGLVILISVSYGMKQHLQITGKKFVRLADLSQKAREVVEVERIVLSRQFGIQDYFLGEFTRSHEEFLQISLRQGILTAKLRAVILMLNSFAFLAIVLFGGILIVRNSLSAGGLIAILFVVGQLLANVAQISTYAVRAAETATAGKRLSAYWQTLPTATPHPTPPDSIQSIQAQNVSFRYQNGLQVLENVSITLHREQVAALTAETGAGKTTLALLLSGLLRPTQGHISINGNPHWQPTMLQPGQVLYVGSKPILRAGSVKDNLFLDPSHHQVDDVDEALAQFFARITRSGQPFPIQEPIIQPNGTGVSSGQAQLIQLARSVLRNPELIIFDEATSSLDMETEAIIQEELLAWCQQRVCLVISHRRCPWTEKADVHLTL